LLERQQRLAQRRKEKIFEVILSFVFSAALRLCASAFLDQPCEA